MYKAILVDPSLPEDISFSILKPHLGENRYLLGAVNSFDGHRAVPVIIGKGYQGVCRYPGSKKARDSMTVR
jgi:hypothetical protein